MRVINTVLSVVMCFCLTGDCHDADTVRLMHTPRCDVPDFEERSTADRVEFENYLSRVESNVKIRRRKKRQIRKNKLRKKRYVLHRKSTAPKLYHNYTTLLVCK